MYVIQIHFIHGCDPPDEFSCLLFQCVRFDTLVPKTYLLEQSCTLHPHVPRRAEANTAPPPPLPRNLLLFLHLLLSNLFLFINLDLITF